MKPMLAEDFVEKEVRFPIGMQPKIDGVRSLKLTELLTGRSLKNHANLYITNLFSCDIYNGFDGEMAVLPERHPHLCRFTSSALSSIDGKPGITWHVFDYITAETKSLVYKERYQLLKERLKEIARHHPMHSSYLQLVPMVVVNSIEEMNQQDTQWLLEGYEGSILRDLEGLYKEGRSTVNEGGLLRIKRFIEEEATVLKIIEGVVNNNEKKKNELGRSERSSHKANLVPNGLVGSLLCLDLKTGKEILVGAGSMDHKLRKYYFDNPHLLVGHLIKYSHFPKGRKDKPRFPTFQSLKISSDIG